MLDVECLVAAAVVVLVVVWPSIGDRWFSGVERLGVALSRRRALSVVLVGLCALVARAAFLPIEPVPQPRIDDEFGYLLTADTFVHGRITNPTPTMWQHLESIHEIMRPTYNSQYPIAPALVLAFGKILGHPFTGVILSAAAMCAAICWMLQGWLPEEWALLGGLLAMLQFGIISYWADSYWGGAVPAFGGALVLGAYPRIKEFIRTRDALLLGLGVGILGNSRPYEGGILSILVLFALVMWAVKSRGAEFVKIIRRIALPTVTVILLCLVGTGFYFYRVTGDPFRMPYAVERAQSAVAPYFLWQHPKAIPVYSNLAFYDYYVNDELAEYQRQQNPVGLLNAWRGMMLQVGLFFVGPVLLIPLIAAMASVPYGLRWRQLGERTRFLLIATLVPIVGLALEVFHNTHYVAPVTASILALVLVAIKFVRNWRIGSRPVGIAISRLVPLACALIVLYSGVEFAFRLDLGAASGYSWHGWSEDLPTKRTSLLSELRRTSGKNLVFVHYTVGHEGDWSGWVVNDSDIDASRDVWAWDLGPDKNRELIEYYKDRRAWIINSRENPPHLIPYR